MGNIPVTVLDQTRVRDQLERLAARPEFSRADRMVRFLRYVVEKTLADDLIALRERQIGIEVFERASDWDPKLDNIVRTEARRLRSKLETYAASNDPYELVRITMPTGGYGAHFENLYSEAASLRPEALPDSATDFRRELVNGGYVPGFDDRNVRDTSPAVASANEEARSDVGSESSPSTSPHDITLKSKALRYTSSRLMRGLIFSLTICSLLLVTICIYQRFQLLHLAGPARSDSRLISSFWSQLFPVGQRNLIVPGDSGLVLLENLTGSQIPLNRYISKEYLSNEPSDREDTEKAFAKRAATKRLTSLADLEFMEALHLIPEMTAAHPKIRFARDLQLADIRESNIIFLGAEESDPWLSLFQSSLNFELSNNQETTVFKILNRQPQTNEPSFFQYDPRVPEDKAYAVVSFRSNLNGRGNILIVEGTGIAGTEAAVDFLSDNARFEQVLRPMFQHGKLKGHFEVLLQTTPLNGTAPRTDLISVRYSP